MLWNCVTRASRTSGVAAKRFTFELSFECFRKSTPRVQEELHKSEVVRSRRPRPFHLFSKPLKSNDKGKQQGDAPATFLTHPDAWVGAKGDLRLTVFVAVFLLISFLEPFRGRIVPSGSWIHFAIRFHFEFMWSCTVFYSITLPSFHAAWNLGGGEEIEVGGGEKVTGEMTWKSSSESSLANFRLWTDLAKA